LVTQKGGGEGLTPSPPGETMGIGAPAKNVTTSLVATGSKRRSPKALNYREGTSVFVGRRGGEDETGGGNTVNVTGKETVGIDISKKQKREI